MQHESEMAMILYLALSSTPDVHLYFRRPREEFLCVEGIKENEAFVTFYSPRRPIPLKLAPNDFRLQLRRQGLFQNIVGLLRLIQYEMPQHRVTVHFGWPQSSWLDRMAIGVMVFSIMKLPKMFPEFTFVIEYFGKKDA